MSIPKGVKSGFSMQHETLLMSQLGQSGNARNEPMFSAFAPESDRIADVVF